MSKRRIGLLIMIIGVLALAAGLSLGGYNLWDSRRAGTQADALLNTITLYRETEVADRNETIEMPPELVPDTDRELQTLEIDGLQYIGTVSIPAIDVELPVQENWSLPQLKTSPCRYMGSPYRGDLIICAHNYDTHFGRLKNLQPGDQVVFTDIYGDEFHYTTMAMDTLAGTAVEEMESGEWDLTLFTCTLGGRTRVTVRCNLLETDKALP